MERHRIFFSSDDEQPDEDKEVASMRKELVDVASDLCDKRLQFGAKKNTVLCKEGEFRAQQKNFDAESKTICNLASDVAKAANQLRPLKEKNEKTLQSIGALQESLRKSYSQIENYTYEKAESVNGEEIDDLRREIRILEKQNNRIKEGIATMKEKENEANEEIEKLKAKKEELMQEQISISERESNAEEEIVSLLDGLSVPVLETEIDEEQIQLVADATEALKKLIEKLPPFEVDDIIEKHKKEKEALLGGIEQQKDVNHETEIAIELETVRITGLLQSKPQPHVPSSPTKTATGVSASSDYIHRIGERFDARYNAIVQDKEELKKLEEKYEAEKAPTQRSYQKKIDDIARLSAESSQRETARNEVAHSTEELQKAEQEKETTISEIKNLISTIQSNIEFQTRLQTIHQENERLLKQNAKDEVALVEAEHDIEERTKKVEIEEEELRSSEFAVAAAEEELRQMNFEIQDLLNDDQD